MAEMTSECVDAMTRAVKGEALSPRLQALLQHRQHTLTATKLTRRLRQINKIANPPPAPAKTE